jgi:hypothetical protein
MTDLPGDAAAAATLTPPPPPPPAAGAGGRGDHRGSPIPTMGMITTRHMELRKRRGLMIALILVTIGIPTVFLVVRLLLHAFDPKSYGVAGGYDIYTSLVAGVLYVFGFWRSTSPASPPAWASSCLSWPSATRSCARSVSLLHRPPSTSTARTCPPA